MTLLMSAGMVQPGGNATSKKLAALAETALRRATAAECAVHRRAGRSSSSRPEQPDRLVALEQIEQVAQRLAARATSSSGSRASISAASSRAAPSSLPCTSMRATRKPGMPDWRVPSTSPSPRSRKSSSAMRKPSSVSRMISSRALAVSPSGALVEQQAGRALGAAADAAAQLVQLRQPEALGVLDHHHGRLRHVDADLDHRGGDQEPRLAGREARHGARPCRRPSCGRARGRPRRRSARCSVGEALLAPAARSIVFGFLDQRADPVDPPALVERAADRVDHLVEPVERQRAGVDRLAAGRLLAQLARRPCRRNR